MSNVRIWLVLATALSLVCLGWVGPGHAGSPEEMEFALSQADVQFVGEREQDWAAYSVSPAGDVNADGYADLLVGAPLAGHKVPGDPPKGEGVIYLILGRPLNQWPPHPINLGRADASFLGCMLESMTGRQNYAAGDVNGDGFDDFLISGWKCSADKLLQGKAYLFLGRENVDWGQQFPVEEADASFLGEAERDHAGYYVNMAGDVNADGYDDFLIASPHNSEAGSKAGQVYLILGRAQADWGHDYLLSQADASFLGEAADDRAGRSVAGVGDANCDGHDDFLIGAIYSDQGGADAGQSYLILGRGAADWGIDFPLSQADASFVGEAAADESGRRVAGAGDVNGDGCADLLIAASRHDQMGLDSGKVYLILGRPEADWGLRYPLAQADASFLGEQALDQAGRRVSSAGDYDGDGLADLLVGAPHNGRGGEAAGAAYLILGREAADWGQGFPLDQADMIYVGESPFDVAGYDVAPAGDVDGNGFDDFVIGAYGGRLDTQDLAESTQDTSQQASPGKAHLLLSHTNESPGIPLLVFPPDGTLTGRTNITFTWQVVAGGLPETFRIELDGTAYFAQGTNWSANLDPGVHTWRVRALNAYGTSPYSEAWTVEVGDVPLSIHVGDITMRYRFAPSGYTVRALVPIWDEEGNPIAGAEVTAVWALPARQTKVQTATSGATGTAMFAWTSPQTGLWVITVKSVQMQGYEYDPGMNQETNEWIIVP